MSLWLEPPTLAQAHKQPGMLCGLAERKCQWGELYRPARLTSRASWMLLALQFARREVQLQLEEMAKAEVGCSELRLQIQSRSC